MEQTVSTSRLKLTLITTAERGSKELDWLHEIRSDEKATWWSIYGRSKTLEDTEKVMKGALPLPTSEPQENKPYRIVYAIHESLPHTTSNSANQEKLPPTQFIGSITLRSLGPETLQLPPHLFPPTTLQPDCLTMELGYQFLPAAWGKGYATESLTAVLGACKRATTFWTPYEKVYVRAIVNGENPASQRVMSKCGVDELGVFVKYGEPIWLAGEWRGEHRLVIFGGFVV